ncbi:hypothetical protein AOLI_G00062770 [Acnodon oligacanthus]
MKRGQTHQFCMETQQVKGTDIAGWSVAIAGLKKGENIRKQGEPWPWLAGKAASWPTNKKCWVRLGKGSCYLARDHSGQWGHDWIHIVVWEPFRTEWAELLLTLAMSLPSVSVSHSPVPHPHTALRRLTV